MKRDTGLNTKGGVAIYIHSMPRFPNPSGSIAVDFSARVIIHHVAVYIVGVIKSNCTYIAGCRKSSCRQEG